MPEPRRSLTREDLLLFLASVALGLAGAAVFGAYRAVSASDEGTSERLIVFGASLLWPGVLIIAGVAATVWFGWKTNLD